LVSTEEAAQALLPGTPADAVVVALVADMDERVRQSVGFTPRGTSGTEATPATRASLSGQEPDAST